jgi:DNA polymerase elongation subunit (family B)
MNTFYGSLGDASSNIYNPLVAGIITNTGRRLLKYVQEECTKNKLIVRYGDTDSMYSSLSDDDIRGLSPEE